MIDRKRCWACGRTKPLDDFHPRKGRGDGDTSGLCKLCSSKSIGHLKHVEKLRAKAAAQLRRKLKEELG